MYMAITTRQKTLLFILLFSLGGYAIYPFINGVGCDFYAETEDEFRTLNMTCFAGVLTSVYYKKQTGDVIVTKSLWGRKGNSIYLINYRSQMEQGQSELKLKLLPSFIRPDFFSSQKIFQATDGRDVVLSDSPVMRAYKVDRIGILSWL